MRGFVHFASVILKQGGGFASHGLAAAATLRHSHKVKPDRGYPGVRGIWWPWLFAPLWAFVWLLCDSWSRCSALCTSIIIPLWLSLHYTQQQERFTVFGPVGQNSRSPRCCSVLTLWCGEHITVKHVVFFFILHSYTVQWKCYIAIPTGKDAFVLKKQKTSSFFNETFQRNPGSESEPRV